MANFFIEWFYHSCIAFVPIYFVFDLTFLYGWFRLGKYGSFAAKWYRNFAFILTFILAINCIAIHILERFVS